MPPPLHTHTQISKHQLLFNSFVAVFAISTLFDLTENSKYPQQRVLCYNHSISNVRVMLSTVHPEVFQQVWHRLASWFVEVWRNWKASTTWYLSFIRFGSWKLKWQSRHWSLDGWITNRTIPTRVTVTHLIPENWHTSGQKIILND